MKLLEAFNITKNKKEIISFVGGGGKTTTMFKLAHQLKKEGYRVLVTTTTAIFFPQEDYFDRLFCEDKMILDDLKEIEDGEIYLMGREINKEGKLLGVSFQWLEEIVAAAIFDVILIEADGSKGRPIKAPAPHEPMVFPLSTINIGVIGLDAINTSINEGTLHRYQEFCSITGGRAGELISPKMVKSLVIDDAGIFKNTPSNCKKILLLNKSDVSCEEVVLKILNELEDCDGFLDAVFVAAMTDIEPIKLWRKYR